MTDVNIDDANISINTGGSAEFAWPKELTLSACGTGINTDLGGINSNPLGGKILRSALVQ